jgi:epoxide hydrolase 4
MTASMQGRDEYFDVGEVRLHAAVQGPDAGPGRGTIVMLHGFPEFWYCWRHQIPEFARDYRVVAPDMRGYNLSDKPEAVEAYKMPHLVGDIRGLIDALGEERVILMAHDWGGAVAWAFAASHPDRLRCLIILNAPHPSMFMREQVMNPSSRKVRSTFICCATSAAKQFSRGTISS